LASSSTLLPSSPVVSIFTTRSFTIGQSLPNSTCWTGTNCFSAAKTCSDVDNAVS
jgi:hypothetical protein